MIHALLTGLAVSQLTAALDHHDKTIESYFAPSFAVSLCTLPLYPVLAGKLGLFAISALNSALVAIIIAFVLVYLSWRAIETVNADSGPHLAAFVHIPPLARGCAIRRKGFPRITLEELVDAGEAMLLEMIRLARRAA